MKKVSVLGILCVFMVFLGSCKKSAPTVPEVPDPPTISSFTATPSEIFTGNNSTLSWGASNATTVSINQGIGNVSSTGTQEVGPTVTTSYTLTATNSDGTVTKSCTVTVKPITSAVTVTSPNSTIWIGKTEQMTATATMSDGSTKAATGTWGSDNTNVATVNQSGLVTGIASGTATIYIDTTGNQSGLVAGISPGDVTITGMRGNKKLTVQRPTPTSVAVTSPNSTIWVGDTEQMTATVTWSDGTIKAAAGTWSSSNTTVATVNQSGLVTGNQGGGATIRFDTTEGSKRGSKALTVYQPWSRSGVGNNVFNMPTSVSVVRITGTFTGFSSNFVVWVGGDLLVNELLGTGWGTTQYVGTHTTIGGLVEIQLSTGVSWSLTEVQITTAITNSTRKIPNIPSKSDSRYREYEIYKRVARQIK